MTLAEFRPEDATGPEEKDFLFRSYITGPDGAHYQLLRESHHTHDDLMRARRHLRRNFDVVSIETIPLTTR
jgi:hypothetical protein